MFKYYNNQMKQGIVQKSFAIKYVKGVEPKFTQSILKTHSIPTKNTGTQNLS